MDADRMAEILVDIIDKRSLYEVEKDSLLKENNEASFIIKAPRKRFIVEIKEVE